MGELGKGMLLMALSAGGGQWEVSSAPCKWGHRSSWSRARAGMVRGWCGHCGHSAAECGHGAECEHRMQGAGRERAESHFFHPTCAPSSHPAPSRCRRAVRGCGQGRGGGAAGPSPGGRTGRRF